MSLPLLPILSQISPVYIFIPDFFNDLNHSGYYTYRLLEY